MKHGGNVWDDNRPAQWLDYSANLRPEGTPAWVMHVMEEALKDKRLRIDNAGNIAEAALEINECFRSAQNAAEQYLNEIKMIREETEAERRRILSEAHAEAEAIITCAKNTQGDYNSAVEAILQEFGQNSSDNG